MRMRLHTRVGLMSVFAVLSGCAAATSEGGGGGGGGGGDTPGAGGGACAATCGPHASCVASGDVGACKCLDGFAGDGETCADVDECASGAAACGANAACENSEGSFSCTCKPGFTGDGKTCADVDECAPGTASCDPNATCQNTAGSFTCACKTGFTGDGKTCALVDKCAQGMTTCDPNATCTSIPGGYTCTCKPGFTGDGKTCTNVAGCSQLSCDPNATCQNMAGSFACVCKAGFTGDGSTCADVDECQQMTAGCDANATCQNTAGSFVCACKPGYSGNGITCTPVGLGTAGDVAIEGGADTVASTSVTLYLQEPDNLLQDPGGESGALASWQIIQSGGDGWASTTANHLFGQRAFITSYSMDTRSQLLDLTTLGFTQQQLDAAPPIGVHEWFQGTGVPANLTDKYYLKVELRAADNTVLASLNASATTSTASAAWQASTQTFTGYGAGLRYVYFEDGGQDKEFWAGQYGSAMDGASVVVGAVQVRFSNDNATWSAWQPFAVTLPWQLDPASGPKTVYVQYMTASGVMWPAVSDTITLQ